MRFMNLLPYINYLQSCANSTGTWKYPGGGVCLEYLAAYLQITVVLQDTR